MKGQSTGGQVNTVKMLVFILSEIRNYCRVLSIRVTQSDLFSSSLKGSFMPLYQEQTKRDKEEEGRLDKRLRGSCTHPGRDSDGLDQSGSNGSGKR